LTRPPFVLANPGSQGSRKLGLKLLLDWLEAQEEDHAFWAWAAVESFALPASALRS
jgi:hypothetical protein